MTDPIRWDNPSLLEAVHEDGWVGEIGGLDGPDSAGDYLVDIEDSVPCWFRPTGDGLYNWTHWTIRNKTPQPCCDAAKELAELREVLRLPTINDAVQTALEKGEVFIDTNGDLRRFIQPEPVKVDPLHELRCVLRSAGVDEPAISEIVVDFQNRGLTITEGEAK